MPWDDFASAQLSFPYLVGLAARYRGIKFEHFDEKTRKDPAFAEFADKLTVSAPAEIDQLYPRLRPARVTVTTPKGKFVRQADEAWGSRLVPLDDEGLIAKFLGLVGPVLGEARAKDLSERLWTVDKADDVAPLVEALASSRPRVIARGAPKRRARNPGPALCREQLDAGFRFARPGSTVAQAFARGFTVGLPRRSASPFSNLTICSKHSRK